MAVCKGCTFRQVWDAQDAATAATLWHVLEAHPLEFSQLAGMVTLPAEVLRPHAYGERLA